MFKACLKHYQILGTRGPVCVCTDEFMNYYIKQPIHIVGIMEYWARVGVFVCAHMDLQIIILTSQSIL